MVRNMDNNDVIIEGDLNAISDRPLFEALNFLFLRQKIADWIWLAICVFCIVFYLVIASIYGFDIYIIILTVLVSTACVFAVIRLFVKTPRQIKASAAQFRKAAAAGHYVYYPDRRVVIRKDTTSTLRYEEIFKAKELKYSWIFYVGEKDAWQILIHDRDSYPDEEHYEKALELLLSGVPEKSIKHRK